MASNTTRAPSTPQSLLEMTIETLEKKGRLQDARHGHSLEAVAFLMPTSCKVCSKTVAAFGNYLQNSRPLRCLTCHAAVHRSCACRMQPCRGLQRHEQEQRFLQELHQQEQNDGFNSGSTGGGDLPMDGLAAESSSVSSDEEEKPRVRCHHSSHAFAVATVNLPVCHDDDDDSEEDDEDKPVRIVQPLHQATHPFASVSKALQENILAHFTKKTEEKGEHIKDNDIAKDDATSATGDDAPRDKDAPEDPSLSQRAQSPHPIVQFANNTMDVVRSSLQNSNKLGVAFAGGIVGGAAAGLLVAGPAGALAGCVGQMAAGALGVILEGSVSVGVVVAGVATGANTAHQLGEKIRSDRRILTMGEEGISRKVLLVRPSIQSDPIWELILLEARQQAPSQQFINLPLPGNAGGGGAVERYRRDEDILYADKDELAVTEKVLLLTSRILNDPQSLPGHIYRFLLAKFRERCNTRQTLLDRRQDSVNGSVAAFSRRARRDDAHAVIKYVTATLLEVRPSFSTSPEITEMAATAVESLVFGSLYDLVFEEVVLETADQDEALLQKIAKFENEGWVTEDDIICVEAVEILRRLPDAHSVGDKLRDCVRFLEMISEYFRHRVSINADSLLSMVCRHIVRARLSRINAEVLFLEEFARDEQLLRGREGYALATLQASLGFLNMCEDIERDIFEQDEDEKNLPMDDPVS